MKFMSQPNYRGAIAHALKRLKNDLPITLTYHNLWHTQEEVMPACLKFAQLLDVAEADLRLLEVAAAYHDLGFVEDRVNHELIGARMIGQTLPQFGFSDAQIERIIGMVMATRLPQSPRNLLEEILADADLDVLGRPDFMIRNAILREEWANYNQTVSIKTWYQRQVAFMREHTYFTAVAQMLRNESKLQNIALLEANLNIA